MAACRGVTQCPWPIPPTIRSSICPWPSDLPPGLRQVAAAPAGPAFAWLELQQPKLVETRASAMPSPPPRRQTGRWHAAGPRYPGQTTRLPELK